MGLDSNFCWIGNDNNLYFFIRLVSVVALRYRASSGDVCDSLCGLRIHCIWYQVFNYWVD